MNGVTQLTSKGREVRVKPSLHRRLALVKTPLWIR